MPAVPLPAKPEVFYPAKPEFVLKKAEQLHRCHDGLRLSVAQEATSRALGFPTWFDAKKRIATAKFPPSPPDESVPLDRRLRRRYQQIEALTEVTGLGIPEIEEFVRRWGLTTAARSRLTAYRDLYSFWDELRLDLAAGKYDEEERARLWENSDLRDGPSVVAPGILLAPIGRKYMYYVLSPARAQMMPSYLRGNRSILLDFEEGKYLALAFPEEFPASMRADALAQMEQHEPWLFEWATGAPPTSFRGQSMAAMAAEADAAPKDWFALSLRFPPENGKDPLENSAVPALRGADFARFLRSRGVLSGLRPQWFALQKGWCVPHRFGMEWPDVILGRHATPRLKAAEIAPSLPLFGTPFKFGPMRTDEYDGRIEGGGYLLSEDWMITDDV